MTIQCVRAVVQVSVGLTVFAVVGDVRVHAQAVQCPSLTRSRTNRFSLQSNRGPQIERLQKWLAAVERHEPGTVDDPINTIGSWRGTEMQELPIEVRTLIELMREPETTIFFVYCDGSAVLVPYSPTELEALRVLARDATRRGDANDVLKRGALLHTDVAILAILEPAEAGPRTSPGDVGAESLIVRFNDGLQRRLENAAGHWEMASSLLEGVTPDPSKDEMVRLWYRATVAFQQSEGQLDSYHLERALKRFPTDATIVFFSGCLHETFASPEVQSLVQSTKLPSGVTLAVGSARGELRVAETFFRQALTIDPGLTEARVRLGRVLGLQGRHADAATELRQALATTQDSLLRYYAELFLGGEAEALGHFAQARRSYQRAEGLYPRAQSPLLALSRLANRSGARAGALSAIQAMLLVAGDAGDDPWWAYHVVQGRTADALLSELGTVSRAARGAGPVAFDWRCAPLDAVTGRSQTAGTRPRSAVPDRRLACLYATWDVRDGLSG